MSNRSGKINLANGGVVDFHLYPEIAPITVENFINLSNSGFYDGLVFHRVIPGFIVQTGCPVGDGTGDAGYTIACEVKENPKKNVHGAMAMAHTGIPDTGSSQFYICLDTFAELDGVYTVFGQVIKGMESVKSLSQGDLIQSIRVE